MVGLLVVLYLVAVGAAVWESRRKGYREGVWLILAVLLGPIALVGLMVLPSRAMNPGEVVRFASPVALADGRTIPRGHISVVREARSRGDQVVCQVSAPDASLHWVAQQALSRTGTVAS